MDQPDFFDALSLPPASAPAREPTIAERCAAFDRAHPEVYAEIKRLALDALARQKKRIGIALLVEVARWNLESAARDGQGYKLNNSYRAIWVRRLVDEVPELAPLFSLRERKAA
jgi:hypothetical protein